MVTLNPVASKTVLSPDMDRGVVAVTVPLTWRRTVPPDASAVLMARN